MKPRIWFGESRLVNAYRLIILAKPREQIGCLFNKEGQYPVSLRYCWRNTQGDDIKSMRVLRRGNTGFEHGEILESIELSERGSWLRLLRCVANEFLPNRCNGIDAIQIFAPLVKSLLPHLSGFCTVPSMVSFSVPYGWLVKLHTWPGVSA